MSAGQGLCCISSTLEAVQVLCPFHDVEDSMSRKEATIVDTTQRESSCQHHSLNDPNSIVAVCKRGRALSHLRSEIFLMMMMKTLMNHVDVLETSEPSNITPIGDDGEDADAR
jgi:hypothetical protein